MKKDADIEIIREYELFRRREEAQPHMSYAHEKLRYRVITEGRIEDLENALLIPPDGTSGILSDNELRHQKNMLIASITMFTRAAIDGGLPEELAFAMSDSYIRNGEKCTNSQEVHRIYMRSFREFTCAVAEKGSRHHSAKVEAVMHYVHIHLHETVTLEKAAEAAGLSACHLSRVFRQETGMSLVDYVQKERVEAARHMLIYSDFTLAVISEYLNFSTQSYFIKIFKKHTGMTPAQYRKYYREEESW
jgi:YesN/AraC family two-component response regulator